MNKFIVATMLLILTCSTAANNLSMMMNGVKIVDVVEGKEQHSFSVNRVDLLPAPCSDNRIVFKANLPTSGIALNLLLDAQHEDTLLEELEYNYGDDGQCHLMRFEEAIPKVRDWIFKDLIPLSTVFVDSDGNPRLVAIGCPNPFNYKLHNLYYEFMQFGGVNGDTMRQFSEDMCVSKRSDFLDHTNWDFPAYWRVCNLISNQCTEYIQVYYDQK